MFLCSYVLIYYPSVCNSGRNTIASLREWKTPPGDFLTPQLLTACNKLILSELDGDASHDLYAGGGKAEVVVVAAVEEVVPVRRHR